MHNNNATKDSDKDSSKHKNPFKKLMLKKLKPPMHHKTDLIATTDSDNNLNRLSNKKKDNKKILFELQESEIAVYKSVKDIANSSLSSSTSSNSLNSIYSSDSTTLTNSSSIHHIIKNKPSSVISQGKFQIYQINNTLNYLSCGSLTHPILRSSQIIKINVNTFIIPIKNQIPNKYWRLTLNTNDENILSNFITIIKPISKFSVDLMIDYTLHSPFCTLIDNSHQTTSSTSQVTLKSFLHVESDDNLDYDLDPLAESNITDQSLIIQQPVPIRPGSTSTNSLTSSILHKYNSLDSNSSLNTSHITYNDDDLISTRKSPEINPISESTDLQQSPNSNKDVNELSNVEIDSNLDLDSDLDLDLELELENDLQKLDLNPNETEPDALPDTPTTLTLNIDSENKKFASSSLTSTDELDSISLEENTNIWKQNSPDGSIMKRYSLSFKTYDLQTPMPLEFLGKFKNDLKSVIKKNDGEKQFNLPLSPINSSPFPTNISISPKNQSTTLMDLNI